jgi:hypothetical protein
VYMWWIRQFEMTNLVYLFECRQADALLLCAWSFAALLRKLVCLLFDFLDSLMLSRRERAEGLEKNTGKWFIYGLVPNFVGVRVLPCAEEVGCGVFQVVLIQGFDVKRLLLKACLSRMDVKSVVRHYQRVTEVYISRLAGR